MGSDAVTLTATVVMALVYRHLRNAHVLPARRDTSVGGRRAAWFRVSVPEACALRRRRDVFVGDGVREDAGCSRVTSGPNSRAEARHPVRVVPGLGEGGGPGRHVLGAVEDDRLGAWGTCG